MLSNKQERITVLVIGTHDLFRRSFENLISIQSDMELFGTVVSSEEAMDKESNLPPSVILIDLSITEMESLTPIQNIHKKFPQIPIIATSGFPTHELVEKMMKSGVKKYIKRGDSAHSIVDAIRELATAEANINHQKEQ